MIYSITDRYEDADYRDIQLDVAVSTFAGPTYQIVCVYNKADDTIGWTDWEFSESQADAFDEVKLDDVPLWAKGVWQTLRVQIEAKAKGVTCSGES